MTSTVHQATCRFCHLPVAVKIPVMESPANGMLLRLIGMAGSVACNRCYDYETAQSQRIDHIQRLGSAILRADDESTATLRSSIKSTLQVYAQAAAEHYEIETEGMVNRWYGDVMNDPFSARVTMRMVGKDLRRMSDEKHLY